MVTMWMIPEILIQVGSSKDLRRPIFGIKLHRDQVSHVDEIRSVGTRKFDEFGRTFQTQTTKPRRCEGQWACYELESGYYIFYIRERRYPVYYRLTVKGFLIEIDAEEAFDDLKSRTMATLVK